MCALIDEADLFAQEQRPHFDAQAQFLFDLTPDGLFRVFASLDPATRQPPWVICPVHMFDEEDTTVVIEDHADRTGRLPWGFEPRRETQGHPHGQPILEHAGVPTFPFGPQIGGAPVSHNARVRS